MADGSIHIDTRVDGKGFNDGVKGIVGSLKGVAAAVGVAFGVGAIVAFGKSAVGAASELASALTGLKSIMDGQGRSFSDAQKFIESYTADGLIPATDAITAYKNLALRGYDDSQIQKVLIALKDSSAYGRQASLTMGEAVKSASEGLKNENSILVDNAGVTKNVAKMWEDYAKSIGTTADKLTQAQKIQAEVNGIMEESKYQTGDAAKVSESYAGQVARLATSFKMFRVAVGQGIIPILTKIIPYVSMVIAWLTVLAKVFAQVMTALFGQQPAPPEGPNAKAATDAQKELAKSTTGAADAQGELADKTKAADKAAKGALASFDELNVLQKDTGAAGTTSETTLPPAELPILADIVPPTVVSPEIQAKVQEFKNKLLKLLEPAGEALNGLKLSLGGLGETVWAGLKWAWDNILVPFGGWVMAKAVPVFLDLLAAGVDVLNIVLIALKPYGIWLWENFLKPAAEWTGQAILDALKWLTERLKDVGKWIKEHPEDFQTLVIILGAFAAAWLLVNGAVAIWNIIAAIAAGVTTAFGAAVAFLTSPIGIVIIIIGLLILAIVWLIKNWDMVKEKAGAVWEWIKDKWKAAGDWFKKNVTDPIGKWFSQAWEDIKAMPGKAWEWIKGQWNTAGDWFKKNVTDPVKVAFETALGSIQNTWETVFTGIGDFVKGMINTIIDLINGMLGAVASGINGVIGGLNSLSVTIPDWVPVFGGQSWGLAIPYVTVPQIPRLATGAVIPPNAEFLAVLGDQRNGRNLEAPEGLIRQIIRDELSQNRTEVTINFAGNLGALVRVLKPYINKENVRLGNSLIQGVS
jgi:hypothetical protein